MNILFNRDVKEFYGENSDKFFVLINAALSFFQANPDMKDPQFSQINGTDMVFTDNSCADEIMEAMRTISDSKELYVSPYEFAQAALSADNIRENGKDSWLAEIKEANEFNRQQRQ